MPTLILASTSRYRQALLDRLGLTFDAIAPACDEEALKDPALAPRDLAIHLADAKAASIANDHPEAIVIGSDQLGTIDGRILGKPGSRQAAIEQLAGLTGRTHQLITAMTVQRGDAIVRHCDITSLTMRELDEAALVRYVDRDEPIDCAGAYKLEAAGISLFSAIDSADHSAITGLPLIALTGILRKWGCQIP